jgi:hypothetical protein
LRGEQQAEARQRASAKSVDHDGILPESSLSSRRIVAVVRRSPSHAAAGSAAPHEFQIMLIAHPQIKYKAGAPIAGFASLGGALAAATAAPG